MSLRRHLLNLCLRLTEKRYLARVQDPVEVRDSFERKARLLFSAPRGTQSERVNLNGVSALRIKGDGPGAILHFHGGAYVFGSARTHRGMLGRLSQLTGLPVYLPDYRLAPEYPFPAAVQDALTTYRALCDQVQGPIILGGDSAGGGLALSLLSQINAAGMRQPALTYALSPFTDMTFAGASIRRNARADVMLPVSRLEELRDMYLQGAAPDDRHASPLFADFSGVGPVLLAVSDTEILEDDTLRLRDRLIAQGAAVDLIHGHDLPHVWPFFWRFAPEADRDLRRIAAAIARQVAR